MTEPRRHGTGWITFAGVAMIIAGANMFINGLWALHASNNVVARFKDTLLFSDSLRRLAGSESWRRRSRRSSPSSGCSRRTGPGHS